MQSVFCRYLQPNSSLTCLRQRLCARQELKAEIEWECDYYSGSRVQLNGDISVTLTDTVDIGFFLFGSFPVEIRAKASGRSQVYYK